MGRGAWWATDTVAKSQMTTTTTIQPFAGAFTKLVDYLI